MKKILSLILAVSMLSAMAVTAFATETEPTDNDGIMLLGGMVDDDSVNRGGGGGHSVGGNTTIGGGIDIRNPSDIDNIPGNGKRTN